MKFKFLSTAIAACLCANIANADPAYDKKLGDYMIHLSAMQQEGLRLKELVDQFDESSQACLDELQAGKPGKVCILVKKDKLDFEYEYRSFKTYNRIRKVPKFERALQDMMQMEMFRLPKPDAKKLYKTHTEAKTARQEKITKIGKQVYGDIDRFNMISKERLEIIADLKK